MDYRLAVTGLAFRRCYDYTWEQGQKPEEIATNIKQQLLSTTVFLRIGLARGWGKFPDRCSLQITGVYTFSDYLAGRCFADFALRQELCRGSPPSSQDTSR